MISEFKVISSRQIFGCSKEENLVEMWRVRNMLILINFISFLSYQNIINHSYLQLHAYCLSIYFSSKSRIILVLIGILIKGSLISKGVSKYPHYLTFRPFFPLNFMQPIKAQDLDSNFLNQPTKSSD